MKWNVVFFGWNQVDVYSMNILPSVTAAIPVTLTWILNYTYVCEFSYNFSQQA